MNCRPKVKGLLLGACFLSFGYLSFMLLTTQSTTKVQENQTTGQKQVDPRGLHIPLEPPAALGQNSKTGRDTDRSGVNIVAGVDPRKLADINLSNFVSGAVGPDGKPWVPQGNPPGFGAQPGAVVQNQGIPQAIQQNGAVPPQNAAQQSGNVPLAGQNVVQQNANANSANNANIANRLQDQIQRLSQKVASFNHEMSPQNPQQGNIGNPGIPRIADVVRNGSLPSAGEQVDMSALKAAQLDLHPDVKIVSSTPPSSSDMSKVDCVPLPKSPQPGVKICIFPVKDDKYVSGALKANKLWEENLVLAMQRALQADPTMMLLDLGCNLGMYALFAAALGRSVLAVEMLPTNVAMIQRSFQLSGLSNRILIVNNALYRDHRILETRFMSQNVGGSRLNTSKVYENIDTSRPKVAVHTICLDDLSSLLRGKTVFMKMDIENSEHHALACAHQFFTEVNVKIVQIEWLNRTPEETTLISNFMKEHGYVLSRTAVNYSPLADSRHIHGADVYFLKKTSYNIL